MDINERIKLIIEGLETNNNAFAKVLNVNPVVTHNIISGRRTKPSYDVLEKILLTYDNISAEWLLRGVGKMFINRDPKQCIMAIEEDKNSTQIVEILRAQLDEVNNLNRELLALLKK